MDGSVEVGGGGEISVDCFVRKHREHCLQLGLDLGLEAQREGGGAGIDAGKGSCKNGCKIVRMQYITSILIAKDKYCKSMEDKRNKFGRCEGKGKRWI